MRSFRHSRFLAMTALLLIGVLALVQALGCCHVGKALTRALLASLHPRAGHEHASGMPMGFHRKTDRRHARHPEIASVNTAPGERLSAEGHGDCVCDLDPTTCPAATPTLQSSRDVGPLFPAAFPLAILSEPPADPGLSRPFVHPAEVIAGEGPPVYLRSGRLLL